MLKNKGQETALLSCLATLRTCPSPASKQVQQLPCSNSAIYIHCYLTKLKLEKGRGVVFLPPITNQVETTQALQLQSLSLPLHTHR